MAIVLPKIGTVAAIAIGPRNAEQLTGQSWRWWRDHAADLGVRIVRVAGKTMIPAEDVARALEQHAEPRPVRELTAEERAEVLLAELGYVPVRR